MVLIFLGMLMLALKYSGIVPMPLWAATIPFWPIAFPIAVAFAFFCLAVVAAVGVAVVGTLFAVVGGAVEALREIVVYLTRK